MRIKSLRQRSGLSIRQVRNAPESQPAWVVNLFLKSRPARIRGQFIRLVHEGLIEVTAGPLCPTPNNDVQTIRAALQIAHALKRQFYFPISIALFSDINGLNWPWAEALREAGVEGLAMGMNYCCGGGMDRYRYFRWETPGGERLPVWHGQHYNAGAFWGLNHDGFDMAEVAAKRLRELKTYP